MAIGGSPRSRRITAWHHTCCSTVRWSAQRACDLCGTRADFWYDGVPIYVLMQRLHAEDKGEGADAPPQRPPAAAQAPAAARSSGPAASSAPAPRGPKPSLAERWSALHGMWLAGAMALVSALGVAASADHGGDPFLPLLIAVAAILLVVLAPMAMAGQPGEAAR